MRILASMVIVIIAVGCARTGGSYEGEIRVRLADGTEITRVAKSQGVVVPPRRASEPTPISVGDDGVQSVVSGVFENAASVVDHYRGIPLLGAAVIVAGLVLGAFLGWKTGIVISIGGALVAALPMILDQVVGVLVAAIIACVMIGIGVGSWYVYGVFRKRAKQSAAKLSFEGKLNEATAAMRAADPEFDAEYSKAKKAR